MRPSAFLDLSLFAIPNTLETVEELDRVFAILGAWADKVGRQTCINIVVTDEAIDALTAANCFPAIHNIQALLDMYNLAHIFSARDLNKRIFKLLGRAGSLRDVTGITIGTFDAECPELDGLADLSDILLASARRLACAIGVFLAGTPGAGDIVAVVPGLPIRSSDLKLRAFNVAAGVGGVADVLFETLDAQIRLCQSPTEFLGGLTAEAVWRHAADGSELVLPIALRAAEKLLISVDELPLSAGRAFAVGEHFYGSLADVEALSTQKHASTTLERCAAIIADNTQIFERDFRKSRRIDSAGARRVHLTKHGAGLRLMFWEQGDGSVEFANVGVKSAMEIDEGDPNRAAAVIY